MPKKAKNSIGIGPFSNAGAPVSGTDEVQTLTFSGTISGGSFKLKLGPFTTAAIAWSATNATLVSNIDAALEALPSVGTGGVTTAVGTMTSGVGTITATFTGANGKKAVGVLLIVSKALTGSGADVAIAVTTPGVDATARGASKAALLCDTTNGKLYVNTGTPTAPVWAVAGTQT